MKTIDRRWIAAGAITCIICAVIIFWVWRVRAPDSSLFSLETWTDVDAWGRRLTGLGWAYHYQTLIGGGLAVVAAGFVFVTSAQERARAREEEIERRRQVIVQNLATLKAAFTRARLILMGGEVVTPNDIDMSLANACIPTIAIFDAWLCEVLTLAIRYTEAALRVRSHPPPLNLASGWQGTYSLADESTIRAGLAYSTVMNFYLRDPEKLVDELARPSGHRAQREHVQAAFKFSKLTWDEVPLMERLFTEQ